MKYLIPKLGFILFLCLFGFISKGLSQIPTKPSTLVNDYAGILSSFEKNQLERKLISFNDSTSTQIAIVTEKSLNGYDDYDRAMEIASNWGIGQKGKNNGILIYVAMDEHKIRILTGYGVEGFLTDGMSRRIIEQIIKPSFRSQQYYFGFDQATTNIIQLHNGEFIADPKNQISSGAIILVLFILILSFLIVFSFIRNRFGGGYYRGGRYFRDDDWWNNSGGGGFGGGWSSGGGGSSSGGGFGGFGGGGFGGGGAGGSW